MGVAMAYDLDTGTKPVRAHCPRRSSRVALSAEVILRRARQGSYRVKIFDVSPNGCKAEFVERPRLDETVWAKFDNLEAIEATVCWVRGFDVGLEFQRAIHPAVFDLLIQRLKV